MPSFIEAVKLGVDVIEFDVLTTSDGVVICHHDPLIEDTGECCMIQYPFVCINFYVGRDLVAGT